MKQIMAAVIADAHNRYKKHDIIILDPELEKAVQAMLDADNAPLPPEPEEL